MHFPQPRDRRESQERVRREQRSDDDGGHEWIAEQQRDSGAQEQRCQRREETEGQHLISGCLEEREIHLEPGHEHQQQLANFPQEVDNRPLVADHVEPVRSDCETSQQQPDRRRKPQPSRQRRNADDDDEHDGELCQERQREKVGPYELKPLHEKYTGSMSSETCSWRRSKATAVVELGRSLSTVRWPSPNVEKWATQL